MAKNAAVGLKRRMLLVVGVLLLLGFSTLIVRLGVIQFVDGEKYKQKAAEQQVQDVQISAKRGTIYDRNGVILAQSATVWNVYISPVDISRTDGGKEAGIIAKGLSEILEVDEEGILEKTKNTKSYYQVIKKKIDKTVADQVRQFALDNDISCIHLEEDTKRYYPYGNLASTVLGFVGTDNQGLYGVEAYYDDELKGTAGRTVSAKNAWGLDMSFRYEKSYDPIDGNDIYLTIDQVIQHYLEKYLEAAVEEHNVEGRGVGIVFDVNTGDILAMSTKPDFDCNDPFTIYNEDWAALLESLSGDDYKAKLSELRNLQWRNKAISDPYEPGSVFKIITTSSALEVGTSSLTDHFNCTGSLNIAGTTIHCWKSGGHGNQDFAHALMNSCNPALMTIGTALGAENFFNYFTAYGMTEKTGITLPGEAAPVSGVTYHPLSDLGPVQLAVSSFGQTFRVSPIQMVTGISAAINGGSLLQPNIVSKVTDSDGNILSVTDTVVKRQVISADTSAEIATILERAVNESSGSKNAYVAGYRVGGKSGTSEKIDEKNEQGQIDKRIASYFAFAPADDPQVAVLIILDEPNSYSSYGSVLAAPVASSVLAEVLPYLGVEPQYTEEELENLAMAAPSVVDMSVTSAKNLLSGTYNLKYRVQGDGDTVVKQVPGAGTSISKNSTVILYTQVDDGTLEKETTKVPNLVGYTASEVNQIAANAGLNLIIAGSGTDLQDMKSVKQDIAVGEEVLKGTVVTVDFISIENAE